MLRRLRSYHRRKALLAVLALPLGLFLLAPATYEVTYDGIVPARPFDVWEYVLDFNNAKTLNPTITNFWLVDDSGGGVEWRYVVGYTEFLHQLPFITNQAQAEFRCLPLGNESYLIQSKHRTCFFSNSTCVYSLSEFIFEDYKKNGKETYCKETVQYECPRLLTYLCYNEVMFQRRSIFNNLVSIFKSGS